MSVHFVEIEEYIASFDGNQGNVNVSGLVYEEFVSSIFFFEFELYSVNNELVSESISFSEDFVHSHAPYCIINEYIDFDVSPGTPIRTYLYSASLVHSLRLTPIDVACVSMDILHGVDTFYQEVSSGLHFLPFTAVANYFLESIYESIEVIFQENAPVRDAYVLYRMSSVSNLNMRHEAIQEYLFNSTVSETLLPFVTAKFGWSKTVSDYMDIMSYALPIIGKLCDEYLFLTTEITQYGETSISVNDGFIVSSTVSLEKYYELLADDSLGISLGDDILVSLIHIVIDKMGLSDVPEYGSVLYFELLEQFRIFVTDKLNSAFNESVGDGIALTDDGLPLGIYSDSVSDSLGSSCSVSMLFALNLLVSGNITIVDSGE